MSFDVQAVVWVLVGHVKKCTSEMLLLFSQPIEAGFISRTGNFVVECAMCSSSCLHSFASTNLSLDVTGFGEESPE